MTAPNANTICQCGNCTAEHQHASDCAVHNAPALPVGPCSCAVRIESRFMRGGDRIIVEPSDGEDFEAEVVMCLGWGLVHGIMNWQMRRDDGRLFTYGIHVNTPVRRVAS